MNTFDNVSKQYAKKALVQKKAAWKLMELLKIKKADSILDVACGPGNLTNELSKVTKGNVVGVDVSPGMISQAKENYPAVKFEVKTAEDIEYRNEFDVVFCNSAIQWFSKAEAAIKGAYSALKPGGRIGVACPGTNAWSPLFIKTIARVTLDPEIKQLFLKWKSPWFFLKNGSDYVKFFEKIGFRTGYFSVDYEAAKYSVEDAYGVYLSGAANGFVSPQYYSVDISDEYIKKFNAMVKHEFEKEAKDGKIILDFNRIYYIGEK